MEKQLKTEIEFVNELIEKYNLKDNPKVQEAVKRINKTIKNINILMNNMDDEKETVVENIGDFTVVKDNEKGIYILKTDNNTRVFRTFTNLEEAREEAFVAVAVYWHGTDLKDISREELINLGKKMAA